MSLNGSHCGETEEKMGSMVSMNHQALESEEMENCDFMSGTEEKDHLIIPSDDEIEKSIRVNQDGSMTVEMKVRLTIKQEEMIHWTTTVSRACVNSQEMAAFSQAVSSHNSPENKDNNSNRRRQSNIDGYESKDANTKTYDSIKLNQEQENHCGNATSEALDNPKPCFRRVPTPGPGRARRKETSLENIERLSLTEVQKSTAGTYSYVEHTAKGELLEEYCAVSHSSSSSTRPVPKPRKKDLRESEHNKNQSCLSGMAEVLQLHNKGKGITETVVHVHQSQDTCENYSAKSWADEDDRFQPKKSDSTESGPQSSSSVSSGSGNARNNEHLSLLSGHSDLSQTVGNNKASSFTDYENQAKWEASDKGIETSTKEDSENKRVQVKKTKMSRKSERSNKHVSLKSTVTDKKQKGNVPDFLKDLKNSVSQESQSCTESDKYGKKVKKRKNGQSPDNGNTCHSNMLRDTSQNMNLGRSDMLRPRMMETLDIIPPSHSAPFKILPKQRSVNGSIIKALIESKELSGSVSMPVLHSSPCNVHQYVKSWLEKIHPESVPYMDELNLHESRVKFHIESDFSGISEIRNELDKDNLMENCASIEGSTIKKPVSWQLLQIRCEGEPMETQNLRRSCTSMSSVRMHTAEQKIGTGKNKSSEELVPKLPDAEGETSPNTQVNPRSGMKDILQQLCLCIQFIRKVCSHSHRSSLKKKNKSSSLPDFSSQLASVFGSPSEVLLSFLTAMTLRDGIASSANEDSGSANNNNSGSNPEALQVMQSIQKLASIEDEEELKASLASLHSSTSAQLKNSLRDFQEKNNTKESSPLSIRQSEQEFPLEVNSEMDGHGKGNIFGIREVMDELSMCEDLRRELSSLVRGDLTNFDRAKSTNEHSGHENETTSSACVNEDTTMKDYLGGSLEEERRYLENRERQYDNITNIMPVDLSKETGELHLLQSSSHKPESDIVKNVQIEDMAMQKGLVAYITEIVGVVKTKQERYAGNEPSKADLCEEKKEVMENVQMIEEKYPEDEISQVNEFQVPDYSPTNLEDNMKLQGNVGCMHNESELLSPTSGIKMKDVGSNCEVIDNTINERGEYTDSLKGYGINSKEEDTYCERREHPKQPGIMSEALETEAVEAQPTIHGTFQAIEKNAIHKDGRSEASDFSVDEVDSHSNDDLPKQVERNNNHEETTYSTSECKNPASKTHISKSGSGTWLESETEHELHKSESESVTETQTPNANENEEADVDEDSDAEPIWPQLHQDGEYSDHTESYKGQESVVKLDLQTLEEERFSKDSTHSAEKKEDETDEYDDDQSSALNTDKDLDTQSNHCYLDDLSIKDIVSQELCKSEKNLKAQSEESEGIEETNMDHECHCVHPTVFPQQLLDFVDLALMSSALIFTYDSNGCLRIEPDRCKNRAMSLSKSNADYQYARRCLPTPNTSDLSDYQPDTSDSEGDLSQVSTDLLTENGEGEAERLFTYQDNMNQRSENISRKVKTLDNVSERSHPGTKQMASSNVKSINSLSSFPDSMVNSTMQDPVYCNSSDSIGNSELAQCLAFHAKTDFEEGILIDKGRWLLKENHLIRVSPPVPMGMYENVDTTSVDTGQESTYEDAYIPCRRKKSQKAVISSSELEFMAKPSTPKCTYFNVSHSSDSDPFLDNQGITNNKQRGFTRKSKEVSPLGETSNMLAKKNGSLSSFTAVEFKLAAGKVHPEDSTASSVVEKSARSQSNTPHEEESVEGLSFRCGQHCPIL